MSHGEIYYAIVVAEDLAGGIDNFARVRRTGPQPFDQIAIVSVGHETDVLTVRLGCDGQGKGLRQGPGGRFRDQTAQGKAQEFQLRLVGGEKEILITSVLDKKLIGHYSFEGLYHERWFAEEVYKRLKSRFEVEIFSGKSVLAVKQDFYTKIMTYNLEALVANVALVKVKEEMKHCQHDYAVNQAQALSRLKGAWVKLMRRPVALLSGFIMQLVKLVAACRESIRPD